MPSHGVSGATNVDSRRIELNNHLAYLNFEMFCAHQIIILIESLDHRMSMFRNKIMISLSLPVNQQEQGKQLKEIFYLKFWNLTSLRYDLRCLKFELDDS